MYRGTTPKIKIDVVTKLKLQDMKQIWVTISNKMHEHTVELEDLLVISEDKVIYAELSQEDTLQFAAGEIRIQVRMLDNNDRAFASNIVVKQMNEILKDGVIE